MALLNAEDQLHIALGFLGALFVMKSIRILRPANAHDMSGMNNTGCSSCRGR